jgi:hypothetical protein
MAKKIITEDISIEALIEEHPFAVKYLSKKGIKCIMCGEPVWGSLKEACQEKGFDELQIQEIAEELRSIADDSSLAEDYL